MSRASANGSPPRPASLVNLLVATGVCAGVSGALRVNPMVIAMGLLLGHRLRRGPWRRRIAWTVAALGTFGGAFIASPPRNSPSELYHCVFAIDRTVWLTWAFLDRGSDHLPSTIDPAEAIRRMGGDPESHEFNCPYDGYARPFVYLGDGLPSARTGAIPGTMSASYREGEPPVIWVCDANHRGHCHLVRGTRKECIHDDDVRAVLERELARAESGEMPYSPAACDVLRAQIARRRLPARSELPLWLRWPYER